MQHGNPRTPTYAENPDDDLDDLTAGFKRRGTFGMPALMGRVRSNGRKSGSAEPNLPLAESSTVEEDVTESVIHKPDESHMGTRLGLEEMGSSRREEDHRRPYDDVEMQNGQHAVHDRTVETPSKSTMNPTPESRMDLSKLATQLYTISYLVFFAIFGTLARLGIQALTTYPGAPVSFGVLWANVGGSLVMGFLAEDRKLFKYERGTATYHEQIRNSRLREDAERDAADPTSVATLAAAKKAYLATKKTIPLYIGLATGFCGSFTSFSSFIRDVFLAMSNDLPGAGGAAPVPRNGGYSFMALLAVVITTVSLSLSALTAGAHLAVALERITPSIPYPLGHKILDRGAVLLGWGSWLGAVFLAIWPPHDAWRGQAVFSLVFAPLGCLARFYVSLWLNSRVSTFPIGTFVVNIMGVAVLGMCWDLGHAGLGGVIGCQVLQGVEDGFCGCLTTVSTWVAELAVLRRRHAYIYGATSVVAGFAVLVILMGAQRWTDGFGALMCTH